MKKLFLSAIFLFSINLYSQQKPEWKILTTSPFQTGRYEDISFINAQQGWGVSGTSSIIRTNNGGESWDVLQAPAPYNVYLRAISLVSPTKAFIGTLNVNYPLIVTPNSGKTFSAITFTGKKPSKICGLFKSNKSIFGVGGFDGNPTFIRSTDEGTTWHGIDMSPYSKSLVDVHFFNDSVGLACGSTGGTTYSNGNSVILRTINSGESWEQVYKSNRLNEWGWKIFFLNDSVGYGSIEKRAVQPPNIFYIKTTDRGLTWSEHFFLPEYDVEGIGFIDESTGWIGGWTGPTYQTTDSGKTWNLFSLSNTMSNLNRIRRINDTLMYGAGTRIFRYAPNITTNVEMDKNNIPKVFTVSQNYPNPFNPQTKIQFSLPEFATVRIHIFNSIGQFVESIMDNPKPAGTYTMEWRPSSQIPSGIYFYQVQTEKETVTRSMIYLK